MERSIVFLLFLTFSQLGLGEKIYSCIVNGKQTYSDEKCEGVEVSIKQMNIVETAPSNTIEKNWTKEGSTPQTSGEALIAGAEALSSFRTEYVYEKSSKAFAQSENGSFSWVSKMTSSENAVNAALKSCRAYNIEFENVHPCKIINVNGVWINR